MEELHLPLAKLLYTIAVMYKGKAITYEESLYLKGIPLANKDIMKNEV